MPLNNPRTAGSTRRAVNMPDTIFIDVATTLPPASAPIRYVIFIFPDSGLRLLPRLIIYSVAVPDALL